MHRILAAAAALGLLALPMQASAQTSSEPTAKNAPAGQRQPAAKASAQKAPNAKTADTRAEGSKVNKAKGKREARLAKTKRMVKHSHKLRYAKGLHGKRFVKSQRGRHAFGYSAPRRLHGQHRYHHRVAYGRGCR